MSHFHTHSCRVEQHFSTAKKQHSFKVYHSVEKKKTSPKRVQSENTACREINAMCLGWELQPTDIPSLFLSYPLFICSLLSSNQKDFFPPKDVSHSNSDAIARPPGLCLQFTSVFVIHVVCRSSSRVNLNTYCEASDYKETGKWVEEQNTIKQSHVFLHPDSVTDS